MAIIPVSHFVMVESCNEPFDDTLPSDHCYLRCHPRLVLLQKSCVKVLLLHLHELTPGI